MPLPNPNNPFGNSTSPFSGVFQPPVPETRQPFPTIGPAPTPPAGPVNETGLPTQVPLRGTPTTASSIAGPPNPALAAPAPQDPHAQVQAALDAQSKQYAQDLHQQAADAIAQRVKDTTPYSNPVMETLRGFNRSLATLVAAPTELVEAGLRAAGIKLSDNPGDATKAIIQGFNSVGIDTTETNSMLNKIGAAGLNDTLTAAALVAAGPELAAYKGANWGGLILKSMGEFANSAPGKFFSSWLAGGAGSLAGADVGEHVAGPIGSTIGAVAGGAIGGGSVPFVSPSRIAGRVKNVADFVANTFKPQEAEPVVQKNAIPATAVRFAEDQIAGDIQRTQDSIQKAITDIPRTGMPEDVSMKAFNNIIKARDYSNSIEDALWARVPKASPVPQTIVKGLESDVQTIESAALKQSPKYNPQETIQEIRDLGASTRAVTDPDTGQVIRNGKPITVDRLLGLHSTIRAQIRADRVAAANGSKAVPQGMLSNLEAIDNAVLDAIGAVLPNNVPLSQAREYTRQQAAMFKQGVVGRILAFRQTGEPAVLPETVGQTLFSSPMGAEAARNADQFATTNPGVSEAERAAAARPGRPLPEGPTPQPLQTDPLAAMGPVLDRTRPAPGDTPEVLQDKARELNDYLTQLKAPGADSEIARVNKQYNDQIQQLEATGGAQSGDPVYAQELARIEGERSQALGQIAQISAENNTAPGFGVGASLEDYIRSAFREAGDQGPVQAEAYIAKNQSRIKFFAGVSDQLNKTATDLKALEAKKAELEKSSLAKLTGTDPIIAIGSIFTSKNPGATATEIIKAIGNNTEASAGLRKGMVDWLFKTTGADPRRMADMLASGSPIRAAFVDAFTTDQFRRLDRIVSLAHEAQMGSGSKIRSMIINPTVFAMKILGTMVGRAMGTGTIQVPGYTGTAFRNFTRASLERAFNILTPSELAALAVEDPRWEKVLYSRVPSDPKELVHTTVAFRRIAYGYQAAEAETQKRLEVATQRKKAYVQ